jgi:hypothetical protein
MAAGFYPCLRDALERRRPDRLMRWIVVAAALAIAAAAVWFLFLRPPDVGGPPLDSIDDASRTQLEEILRKGEAK